MLGGPGRALGFVQDPHPPEKQVKSQEGLTIYNHAASGVPCRMRKPNTGCCCLWEELAAAAAAAVAQGLYALAFSAAVLLPRIMYTSPFLLLAPPRRERNRLAAGALKL